ncbi:hypothetical protein FHQ28_05995 [Pasteurellaceae bacterium USgator11]|uniref:Uncharacterized protein n=2 Tax=Testudinibacter aquarius TaxID=1524974 RepID=A0A4R3Y9X1_9PAST|nr:hypothetical protein A1D24_03970 [Testudinibacter aquarius]TNG90761.1 hypothetical protein FHQ20_12030 [Pasteurellaceae bacterium USgator41]TNG97000.1 hypothetical protein FHQ19_00625 [Pasteurellaceae bacterium UScroc12]TNG98394.1 hypothetical protein FHQ24_08730 [Pasteurellaceae bacterium UScroc31]TNH01428.1 hypothetical protein FHQ28_05995 [Pasteurellaceae bacterium USgator11]
MIIKEKGYDEYLAQKIAAGRADVEAGRVCTLAEARVRWQAVVEELDSEIKQFERDVAYA